MQRLGAATLLNCFFPLISQGNRIHFTSSPADAGLCYVSRVLRWYLIKPHEQSEEEKPWTRREWQRPVLKGAFLMALLHYNALSAWRDKQESTFISLFGMSSFLNTPSPQKNPKTGHNTIIKSLCSFSSITSFAKGHFHNKEWLWITDNLTAVGSSGWNNDSIFSTKFDTGCQTAAGKVLKSEHQSVVKVSIL